MNETIPTSKVETGTDPKRVHFRALEQLVDQLDEFDRDPAFPLHSDQSRRNERRRPFLTEIVIALFEPQGDRLEAFRFVRGRTLNLSRVGMAFVVNEEVELGTYTALINHPDHQYPNSSFLLTVLWTRQVSDNEWEHGALHKPAFSSEAPTFRIDG